MVRFLHLYFIQNLAWMVVCTIPFLHSCAFNIEITSQRTALENQILGSYEEIDASYSLLSSVRSVDESGNVKALTVSAQRKSSVEAKQRQAFNKDDIEEYKDLLAVGEGNDGLLKVVDIKKLDELSRQQKDLLKIILAEENSDRRTIWERVIEQSPDLSKNNIDDVIRVFVKTARENEKLGRYFQLDGGDWTKKESK